MCPTRQISVYIISKPSLSTITRTSLLENNWFLALIERSLQKRRSVSYENDAPPLAIESSLHKLFNSSRTITIGCLLRLLHNTFRNEACVCKTTVSRETSFAFCTIRNRIIELLFEIFLPNRYPRTIVKFIIEENGICSLEIHYAILRSIWVLVDRAQVRNVRLRMQPGVLVYIRLQLQREVIGDSNAAGL